MTRNRFFKSLEQVLETHAEGWNIPLDKLSQILGQLDIGLHIPSIHYTHEGGTPKGDNLCVPGCFYCCGTLYDSLPVDEDSAEELHQAGINLEKAGRAGYSLPLQKGPGGQARIGTARHILHKADYNTDEYREILSGARNLGDDELAESGFVDSVRMNTCTLLAGADLDGWTNQLDKEQWQRLVDYYGHFLDDSESNYRPVYNGFEGSYCSVHDLERSRSCHGRCNYSETLMPEALKRHGSTFLSALMSESSLPARFEMVAIASVSLKSKKRYLAQMGLIPKSYVFRNSLDAKNKV